MPSSPFHTGVSLQGFHFEDFSLTVTLKSGITAADIGKAVTKDGTVANGYRLSGDGDPIDGRLASVESRTVEGTLVGAVEFKFCNYLPIKSGETVVVGDTVVGAGSGEVKAGTIAAETTADGSDAGTTQTLANALKAKINAIIAAGGLRRNMVVAVESGKAVVVQV